MRSLEAVYDCVKAFFETDLVLDLEKLVFLSLSFMEAMTKLFPLPPVPWTPPPSYLGHAGLEYVD